MCEGRAVAAERAAKALQEGQLTMKGQLAQLKVRGLTLTLTLALTLTLTLALTLTPNPKPSPSPNPNPNQVLGHDGTEEDGIYYHVKARTMHTPGPRGVHL